MSHTLPTPLPPFDRRLLRAVAAVVPSSEREDWSQTWQAELWHLHHRNRHRRTRGFMAVADLSIGLTRDALWLRTESWRRTFSGTAVLCLASLASLSVISALLGLAMQGSWRALAPFLAAHFVRSAVAALLVTFVAFATASRRHIDGRSVTKRVFWIKRHLFFAVKILNVLLLAFILSADISLPIRTTLPNTADLLQIFCFVLSALVGLRWAIQDQEQRCKHCLHMLATPARVGRPSHNLLEWNGTELNCKHGHGLLSVPEIETSWCQASHWMEQNSGWDQAASV